jgi:hypothetical protein
MQFVNIINESLFKINIYNKEIAILKQPNFILSICYLNIKFYFTLNNLILLPSLKQKYTKHYFV